MNVIVIDEMFCFNQQITEDDDEYIQVRYRSAIHEAAHAVIREILVPGSLAEIGIEPDGMYAYTDAVKGMARLDRKAAIVSLAGPVADKYLNQHLGKFDRKFCLNSSTIDTYNALNIINGKHCETVRSEHTGWRPIKVVYIKEWVDDDKILAENYRIIVPMLKKYRCAIETVALAFSRGGRLSGDAVREIMKWVALDQPPI